MNGQKCTITNDMSIKLIRVYIFLMDCDDDDIRREIRTLLPMVLKIVAQFHIMTRGCKSKKARLLRSLASIGEECGRFMVYKSLSEAQKELRRML